MYIYFCICIPGCRWSADIWWYFIAYWQLCLRCRLSQGSRWIWPRYIPDIFIFVVGSLRELIFVCSGIWFRSIDIKIPTHHSRCKNSSKLRWAAYQSKLVPRSHGFLFVHFDNLIVATWRLSISFWVGWNLEVGWCGIVLEIWMILNGNGNVAGLLQSSLVFLGWCSSIAVHIWFRHNWWSEGSISQVHSNPQRSTQVNWCLNKSVRNTMGHLGCAFVESKLRKLKYQLQTTPFFPNFCSNKSWWCHLKPKFALRLACALEDVSLLQVAHDPMVPRSERIFSQRCHFFRRKFCILTSLAIILAWFVAYWMVLSQEGMQHNFSRFPVASEKARICHVDFQCWWMTFNLLLSGMKIGESCFQSHNFFLCQGCVVQLWWTMSQNTCRSQSSSDPQPLCCKCHTGGSAHE